MSVAVAALIFTYKILCDQKSYRATEVNNLKTMKQVKVEKLLLFYLQSPNSLRIQSFEDFFFSLRVRVFNYMSLTKAFDESRLNEL